MTLVPDHGRWGILGGTFDPVHHGHLSLALDIGQQKQLTGVLFVPSVTHPFKTNRCQASFADRLHMLHLALADQEHLVVSAIEREQRLSGYTVHTIKAIKERWPQTQFLFIIGADLLGELNLWRNPDEILSEVRILVGGRPDFETALPDGLDHSRFEIVDTTPVPVSSTQVRQAVTNGAPAAELDRLVPPAVSQYIEERGLYQ